MTFEACTQEVDEARIHELEEKLRAAKEETATVRAQLRGADHEAIRLKHELEATQTQLAAAGRGYQMAKHDVAELGVALSAERAENARLRQRLTNDKTMDTIERLSRENKRLTSENQALKKRIALEGPASEPAPCGPIERMVANWERREREIAKEREAVDALIALAKNIGAYNEYSELHRLDNAIHEVRRARSCSENHPDPTSGG
jgi:chromosome segregation ATPase